MQLRLSILGTLAAACLLRPASGADQRYPLWDPSEPIPGASQAGLLEGVEFHVVKRREPEVDGYNWLHGAALAWHAGALYASFGHNRGSENTASEEARYTRSLDGGQSWSEVRTIDAGDEPELAVSHGVFLLHQRRLWAFHGAFYGRMKGVHTRAYLLDQQAGKWEKKGIVAKNGFWPMQEPQRMIDGNWIMAGISVTGGYGGPDDPAAVAVSHGDDLTRWNVVRISKPKTAVMWGESAVIVSGRRLINVARYGQKAEALVAVSEDYGRTWTPSRPSNLPMATSKPYAGKLSTGQHYLICTTTADSGSRRSPLTIAVTRPGQSRLSRVWRIRDAIYPGPGESHPRAALSYPYAVEHEGKLYVAYSNDGGRGANRNSAELAVIPIASLYVPPESTSPK